MLIKTPKTQSIRLFNFCLASWAVCAQWGCGSTATQHSGIDLTQWNTLGESRWHRQSNGAEAINADTQGYLVSQSAYDNFKLVVDFWIADQTNSGVFIRCSDGLKINPDNCYEVNIWDNHPNQPSRTGSIVKHTPPLNHVDTLDQWNTMSIHARGDHIEVFINGIKTVDYRDSTHVRGHVALQYFGKQRLKFRRLRIVTN